MLCNVMANLLDEGVTYLLVWKRASSPFWRSTHNALLIIVIHILAIWLASAGTGCSLVRAAVWRLAVTGSWWRTMVVGRLRLWRVSCWVRSLWLVGWIWSTRRTVRWIWYIWGWCYKWCLSTIAYSKDHTHNVTAHNYSYILRQDSPQWQTYLHQKGCPWCWP